MSALITMAAEASTQAATIHAAGPGLLDWADNLNTELQNLILAVVITLAIIGVVITAVASRFNMAKIIVAGIVAGLFVWVAFNVTVLRDTVGNDLPGAAPALQIVHTGQLTGMPLV